MTVCQLAMPFQVETSQPNQGICTSVDYNYHEDLDLNDLTQLAISEITDTYNQVFPHHCSHASEVKRYVIRKGTLLSIYLAETDI